MDDPADDTPAFDPRRPFLRRTALAAGVTPKELRGPGYRVVLPGVYVASTTVVTSLVRVRAALLPYGEDAWASHASAARVYDLPIPTIPTERRDASDDDGGRLLPVISSGIFSTPEQTLQRIHRVLLARGMPGVPARLGDEWRAHFPGHADAA